LFAGNFCDKVPPVTDAAGEFHNEEEEEEVGAEEEF